jgi:hypothetical protein
VSYTIANLDLSGFRLKAEDVELEMPTLDALEAAVCTPSQQQQSKSTITSEEIALAAAAAAAASSASNGSSSRFRRRSSVRRRGSANVSTCTSLAAALEVVV